MFKKLRTLFTLLIIIASATANADLAIIVHPDYQGGELDQDMVRKLFLGESAKFPSGHKAEVVNHSAGSPDRKAFFEYVLEMSETKHKRYWARKISIGKDGAPTELDSHREILNRASNTPLGITYIDNKVVDDSVKVLFTVTVFDDI